jgi:hypothetical protein
MSYQAISKVRNYQCVSLGISGGDWRTSAQTSNMVYYYLDGGENGGENDPLDTNVYWARNNQDGLHWYYLGGPIAWVYVEPTISPGLQLWVGWGCEDGGYACQGL